MKPSFRKKKQNQEVKKDLSKTALNHITKTLEAIESCKIKKFKCSLILKKFLNEHYFGKKVLANGKYLEALESI